uniref:Reverse transcriptase zinc-binding domain-containing protein n=1 Tax=Arundo donax TaxID=35708 RepID=A0A0A9F7L9_ARUDO
MVDGLYEYVHLWDILSEVVLQLGVEDVHIWRLSTSGKYSVKSAHGLFHGAVQFRPEDRIWKSWAPGKCQFFLWLVAHNRCWTADRLARRGLQRPARCVLCDQVEETIQHLLILCVFARQFWYNLLRRVGLEAIAPQLDEVFVDWWERVVAAVNAQARSGLNSLIILGAWIIWKHRNGCVFDGVTPNAAAALDAAMEHGRGTRYLLPHCSSSRRSLAPEVEVVLFLDTGTNVNLKTKRVCVCMHFLLFLSFLI